MAVPDKNEVVDPNRRRRRRQEIADEIERLRIGKLGQPGRPLERPAALSASHHNPHGGGHRPRKVR